MGVPFVNSYIICLMLNYQFIPLSSWLFNIIAIVLILCFCFLLGFLKIVHPDCFITVGYLWGVRDVSKAINFVSTILILGPAPKGCKVRGNVFLEVVI